MKKTDWEARQAIRSDAEWLSRNPNIQMWDGEAVVVSKTNSHLIYKAWNMSTGERSV